MREVAAIAAGLCHRHALDGRRQRQRFATRRQRHCVNMVVLAKRKVAVIRSHFVAHQIFAAGVTAWRLAVQVDTHQFETVALCDVTRDIQSIAARSEVRIAAVIGDAARVATVCGDDEYAGFDGPVRRRQAATGCRRKHDRLAVRREPRPKIVAGIGCQPLAAAAA